MIDTTAVLLNFKGDPILNERGEMTLRDAIQHAVIVPQEKDSDLTAMDKFHLESLARKVESDGVSLSLEDLTLIKTRIGSCFSQLIIGPTFRLLDSSCVREGDNIVS